MRLLSIEHGSLAFLKQTVHTFMYSIFRRNLAQICCCCVSNHQLPHLSMCDLTADSTRARGWMVSRLPRGICITSLVSPGTTHTMRDPLSSRRTLSSNVCSFPSASPGKSEITHTHTSITHTNVSQILQFSISYLQHQSLL